MQSRQCVSNIALIVHLRVANWLQRLPHVQHNHMLVQNIAEKQHVMVKHIDILLLPSYFLDVCTFVPSSAPI